MGAAESNFHMEPLIGCVAYKWWRKKSGIAYNRFNANFVDVLLFLNFVQGRSHHLAFLICIILNELEWISFTSYYYACTNSMNASSFTKELSVISTFPSSLILLWNIHIHIVVANSKVTWTFNVKLTYFYQNSTTILWNKLMLPALRVMEVWNIQ